MLPLIDADQQQQVQATTREAIGTFDARFEAAYLAVMRSEDKAQIKALFAVMACNGANFTLPFRTLGGASGGPNAEAGLKAVLKDRNSAPPGLPTGGRDWRGTVRISCSVARPCARPIRPIFPATTGSRR
nr:hypothetical protein [Beijerinckia mobilis]